MVGVYFDNLATTPMDSRVRSTLIDAFSRVGNAASSEHSFGWDAARRVESAREHVAALIGGVDVDEVTFTSGATEANNIAILGGARGAPTSRRRILVSSIEHKSVIEAAEAAAREGYVVVRLGVSTDGVLDPAQLAADLNDDVAVVAVMAVNNEIGTIQRVSELGLLARAYGAFFHVDAAQAPAAIEIDARAWHADAISLSSHKIYGPGGVGALFVADDAPWRPAPLTFGGGQESGLRPGTVPVALCTGFGEAAKVMIEEGQEERQRIAVLRDEFATELFRLWPLATVTALNAPRHPGCLHIRFPGIDASELLMRLQPDFAASTGSACSSGILGPSDVVLAIGYSAVEAGECIRFSLGRFTTRAEVDQAIERIRSALASMSPRFAAA